MNSNFHFFARWETRKDKREVYATNVTNERARSHLPILVNHNDGGFIYFHGVREETRKTNGNDASSEHRRSKHWIKSAGIQDSD